jgi:hypothetical protein
MGLGLFGRVRCSIKRGVALAVVVTRVEVPSGGWWSEEQETTGKLFTLIVASTSCIQGEPVLSPGQSERVSAGKLCHNNKRPPQLAW